MLDWEDIRSARDPHGLALEFARSAFQRACAVCEWDPSLAASAQGVPRRSAERGESPSATLVRAVRMCRRGRQA